MIELEAALQQILANVAPITDQLEVPLAKARRQVLARDLQAGISQPPFDNSAMDGYAVKAPLAAGTSLALTQRIAAGQAPLPLTDGAARIFTGAVMPSGANAVVMQEQVVVDDDGTIAPTVDVAPQANVRMAGEDFTLGQQLLSAGTTLGAHHIAIAAAAGHAQLSVIRQPVIGVLVTGDELVQPGKPLQAGQIYNSNGPFLQSFIEGLGASVVVAPSCEDSLQATIDALNTLAEQCDLIVTSGGASVGEEDHLKAAISQLGELALYKIKMKPGKPVLFGQLNQGDIKTPILGLPGNPVSSIVTAALLLKPCIQRLQGRATQQSTVKQQVPAAFTKSAGKRREFLRAQIVDGKATLYSSQGSGVLSSIVWATHLVDLTADTIINEGDMVNVIPLAGLLG